MPPKRRYKVNLLHLNTRLTMDIGQGSKIAKMWNLHILDATHGTERVVLGMWRF